LALGAVLAVTAGVAHSHVACTAGQTTVDGHSAITYCGPAKVTVRVGGKTYAFKGGSCVKTSKSLSVNIGTVVLGIAKQTPAYFALGIGQYYGANPGTPSA